VEVEERECSGGENEGKSVTTAMHGVESVARVKSLVRTFDDLLGLLCAFSYRAYPLELQKRSKTLVLLSGCLGGFASR
jgi:hypothetical protein